MPSMLQCGMAILLAGTLCTGGQQEVPTFRTATTLIEFTLVALDSHGRPVTDLKKEDIRISEQGKSREVAFFRFTGAREPGQVVPLPAGEFSNRSDRVPPLRRNVAAIALDTINTAPTMPDNLQESTYQDEARTPLLNYLRTLPSNTQAALYRFRNDRITVLQDFTDDVEALRARLRGVDLNARGAQIDRGFDQPVSGHGEAAEAATEAMAAAQRALSFYNTSVHGDRLSMTLASLEALGNHMEGMPGRKSIVWMSVGMPVLTNTAGWLRSDAPAVRRTARKLASQGIVLYAVPVGPYRDNVAMDMLAETTGGRVVRNVNDPGKGISVAAIDDTASYSVGFYSAGTGDDQWHGVHVKVQRPGVTLQYRQGYLSAAPTAQSHDWSTDQWRAAIYNSLGSTSLRMDARCQLSSPPPDGMVKLALKFELTDLHFRTSNRQSLAEVEIAIIEKKVDQTYNIQRHSATLRYTDSNGGAVQYTPQPWKLDPQAQTIRVILRDRLTGRYGTVDLPLRDIPVKAAGGR